MKKYIEQNIIEFDKTLKELKGKNELSNKTKTKKSPKKNRQKKPRILRPDK